MGLVPPAPPLGIAEVGSFLRGGRKKVILARNLCGGAA
jgi:hypothetical protein